MSFPHSKPISIGDAFAAPLPSVFDGESALPQFSSADRALDVALRSVPLPEGFLSRLARIMEELPDELSDRVDYLGC